MQPLRSHEIVVCDGSVAGNSRPTGAFLNTPLRSPDQTILLEVQDPAFLVIAAPGTAPIEYRH